MRNKGRRLNALKHGAFAAAPVSPGEDPREFEALYSDLIQEWKPVGATENEAVFSLANAMWRKRRARLFLEVGLIKNSINVNHPSFDQSLGLLALAVAMMREPEKAFERYATATLRPDAINYLIEKFHRSKFESDSEWAQAIIEEINCVLLPRAMAEPSELPDLLRKLPLEQRKTDELRLVYRVHAMMEKIALFGGSAASGDLFEQERTLDERLDAMIDRAVKRLVQTKAMKQMLRQTSNEEAQPGKVTARSTSNRSSRSVNGVRRSSARRTKPAEQAA